MQGIQILNLSCTYSSLQELAVSKSQIDHVEKITQGQRINPHWLMYRKGRLKASNFGVVIKRINPHWLMYRKGRLTASNFGVVIKAVNRNSYPPSLFKRLLGEYDLSRVMSVQWGIDHEDEAADTYVSHMSQYGIDSVEECGIYLDNTGTLGASPDRLVGSHGLLEIKCLYTQRNSTVESGLGSKDFPLSCDANGRITLKENHDYYHQVQGQLYLSGRTTCTVAFWTPANMLLVPVTKDPAWAPKLHLLRNFYQNQLLPKMINGGL